MKFGSPIWRAYNELPRGAYEWALDYQEDNENKTRSNRGGYQSVAQTFDYLPFPFRDHILNSFDFKDKIRPANWWLNVSEKGDFNFCMLGCIVIANYNYFFNLIYPTCV